MPFRYITRRHQIIKAYLSGIGKSAVIMPAAFLAALAFSTLGMGAVFYLRDTFDASGIDVGALFAAWWLSYSLGCFFLRPLADKISLRIVLPVSTFLTGIAAMGIYFSASIPMAVVCACLVGATASFFWSPMMGWLSTGLEGSALSKTMGLYNISWTTACVIGPPLAGWLSQQNPAYPIFLGAGLFLTNAVMITGATLALPKVRADAESVRTPAQTNDVNTGRSTRLRYACWTALVTTFMTMSLIAQVWPIPAQENLEVNPDIRKVVIGFLLLGRALFNAIGMGMIGRLSFWHYRGTLLVMGQLCLAGILIAIAGQTSVIVIAPLLAVQGLIASLSYSYSTFHAVAGSNNRAARMGIHEGLLSLGLCAGVVLGGAAYDYFSFPAACRCFAGIVLVGVAIEIMIVARTARTERRDSDGNLYDSP